STTPVFGEEDLWGAVSGTWQVDVPTHAGGGDQIWVRGIDEVGNVSAPVAVSWNRPLTLTSLVGTWQGVLQRTINLEDSPALAKAFSFGRISLTSTAKGTVSGKLGIYPLMSADVAFTGVMYQVEGGAEFYSKVTLVKGGEPFWLICQLKNTTVDSLDHVMSAQLLDTIQYCAEGILVATTFSTAHPVPIASQGLFNAGIATTPAFGVGTGYFSASVAKTGMVTISGKLGDNTPFTWSGPLGGASLIPVMVPLYSNKGGVAGLLNLNPTLGAALTCERFSWVRPAFLADKQLIFGIDTDSTVSGGKYTPAINLKSFANLGLVAEGEDPDCALDVTLNINPTTGAILLPSPNPDAIKLTVTSTSGLFTGSYLTLDGKTSTYWGLLIGDGAGGYIGQGLFIADPVIGQTLKRFGNVGMFPNP
ncbi:MAG: hypothetical protein U0984_04725, partial [Prosthecobacter sp.]|nr:hypothetical protein [Prosthecobacter sp.]